MSDILSRPDRRLAGIGLLPVRASLPDAPMGIVESYLAARRNLLEIIPRRALHQPVICRGTPGRSAGTCSWTRPRSGA
jgi:hypothetical protein